MSSLRELSEELHERRYRTELVFRVAFTVSILGLIVSLVGFGLTSAHLRQKRDQQIAYQNGQISQQDTEIKAQGDQISAISEQLKGVCRQIPDKSGAVEYTCAKAETVSPSGDKPVVADPSQILLAVDTYCSLHRNCAGADGVSPDKDLIIQTVLALIPRPADGVNGTNGINGTNGKDAPPPDQAAIQEAVNAYCSSPSRPCDAKNTPVPGPEGPAGKQGEQGEQGEKGEEGRGISKIAISSVGSECSLVIAYTQGAGQTIPISPEICSG